jgi:hypothetical protein
MSMMPPVRDHDPVAGAPMGGRGEPLHERTGRIRRAVLAGDLLFRWPTVVAPDTPRAATHRGRTSGEGGVLLRNLKPVSA